MGIEFRGARTPPPDTHEVICAFAAVASILMLFTLPCITEVSLVMVAPAVAAVSQPTGSPVLFRFTNMLFGIIFS
jgi:hypothetical protein